jgi:hypothetical protein
MQDNANFTVNTRPLKISGSAIFESYNIREDEIHRRDQYHDSESLQQHIMTLD